VNNSHSCLTAHVVHNLGASTYGEWRSALENAIGLDHGDEFAAGHGADVIERVEALAKRLRVDVNCFYGAFIHTLRNRA